LSMYSIDLEALKVALQVEACDIGFFCISSILATSHQAQDWHSIGLS
jgi:hypothetical protein